METLPQFENSKLPPDAISILSSGISFDEKEPSQPDKGVRVETKNKTEVVLGKDGKPQIGEDGKKVTQEVPVDAVISSAKELFGHLSSVDPKTFLSRESMKLIASRPSSGYFLFDVFDATDCKYLASMALLEDELDGLCPLVPVDKASLTTPC